MELILTSVYGVYRGCRLYSFLPLFIACTEGVDGAHSYLCLWRVQGVYRWCSFLPLFIACTEGVDGAHS